MAVPHSGGDVVGCSGRTGAPTHLRSDTTSMTADMSPPYESCARGASIRGPGPAPPGDSPRSYPAAPSDDPRSYLLHRLRTFR